MPQTGTLVSAQVLASGVQADVLWSIAAATWGGLSIQPGKTASFTVFGIAYPLASIVSQSDPGGEGALALVRFNLSGSPVPAGAAVFSADVGFLKDPTDNQTPASAAAAATNSVPVPLRGRARNPRLRSS